MAMGNSLKGGPTINDQVLQGYVVRIARQQKGHYRSNILRLGDFLQRNPESILPGVARNDALLGLRSFTGNVCQHGRAGRAGRYDIATNSLSGELQAYAPGEHGCRGLGRTVSTHVDARRAAGIGGNRNDCALTPFGHTSGHGLGDEEGTVDIHLKGRLPFFG